MHASKDQLKSLIILQKRADFVRMNRVCKKWTAQAFVLQIAPNDLNQIRIGYTVTKKTESLAVKRNRIKRRLRAVAADILPLHAKPGHDYVLIGRSQGATRPYETLCRDLKWCLDKLGARKNETD